MMSENMDMDDAVQQLETIIDDICMDNRIKSFGEVGKWFETGPSIKQNMAKMGLYVPDEEHRKRKTVQCVYCQHIFLDWTRNDDPKLRHESESPECLFIKIGKSEEEMTIKQILELIHFSKMRKLEKSYNKEHALLQERFEEMRNFLNQLTH